MFTLSPARARLRPCLLLLLMACSAIALADETAHDPALAPLTLSQALQRAESQHPLFAGWRAKLAAADARALQAAQRPSPELSLTVENVLGTGTLSAASAAESTLGLSQLIERGGLRERRVEASRSEQSLLQDEQAVARLDQRAEVTRRFVHVLADQAQLALTREATQLAQLTRDEVQRRVDAARSPLAEASRAEVALERAQLEEEHAEHELLSSRRHLAAAMGHDREDFGAVQGDLLALPDVTPFPDLLRQLDAAPDLLRYASETRLRESELRLAHARAARPLTVGAGLRRLETQHDVGLVFSASLPLFGERRVQGLKPEAEARLAQVGADREQARLRLQAQLHELWQELNHARVEHLAQRDRVVPVMERALRQTEDAWRRGRYSLLELREAQREWLAQRRLLIQSAAEFHQHHLEIQRLTGAGAPVLQPDTAS